MAGPDPIEHTLEYLLAFDGQIHVYQGGYWLKFDIFRTEPSAARPHGLRYAFTLHGPGGERLVGFDNAHGVASSGSRFGKRSEAADHWHRVAGDEGRPYVFRGAANLLEDFFNEVERVLRERGIPFEAVAMRQGH